VSIPRWSDGSGVGNVADANTIGGIELVHVFDIEDAASDDYDIILANKTEIVDAVAIKTSGIGVAVTAQIKNGSTAITDAMALGVAVGVVVRPSSIDPASDHNIVESGDPLRVSVVRTTGDAGCRIFVLGIKRA
jgi:hypothetical protein